VLTIYAPLFRRRELVFRIVPARELEPGVCEIGPAELGADERWIFGPGDRVYVERHAPPGIPPKLVAVAPSPDAT
jgi:hypothetical protein